MPTRIFGHPIHPMLVVFPIGLLGTSVIFDLIGLIAGSDDWHEAAFLMIGAGLIAALLAAIFGYLDWSGLPDGSKVKQIGLYHMGANTTATILFIASWLLRNAGDPEAPGAIAIILSVLAILVLSVGGWFGGTLVYKHGVAVDDEHHHHE